MAVGLTVGLLVGILFVTTSSATATTGDGHVASIHAYDGSPQSVQIRAGAVAPVSCSGATEGAHETVTTAAEPMCVASRSCVAANTAGTAKPFAMGVSEHLDDFASAHGAETWKSLPDPVAWKPGVPQRLQDPSQRVLFNLDGVDVWPGVTRASAGRGGATDWELLQMRTNNFPNLEFWQGGQRVGNPFQ